MRVGSQALTTRPYSLVLNKLYLSLQLFLKHPEKHKQPDFPLVHETYIHAFLHHDVKMQ